jgi:hypothetical protein
MTEEKALSKRLGDLAGEPPGCVWPAVLMAWVAVQWVKFVQRLKARKENPE